jgi:hypothetical protein
VLATVRDLHCMTRPSARHPLDLFEGRKACPREGGEDDGLPGAAKNTGDDACLGANRASPARACADATRRTTMEIDLPGVVTTIVQLPSQWQ